MYPEIITQPFGRLIEEMSSCFCFDVVYIPSNGERIPYIETLNTLHKWCKRIVFLFSNYIPKWFEYLNYENIQAIKVADYNYSLIYYSKPENRNVSVYWRPDFDIPLKRSYALFHAGDNNYHYIGMIDDDMLLEDIHMQKAAYALEHGNTIVGFHVRWYPDKCTLDHIRRELTGVQDPISMTGSVLFLNVHRVKGDFPLVYNEDLFFFLQQPDMGNVVSGGTIRQKEYNSWKSGERIMHEQFGELVYIAICKKLIKEINKDNSLVWNKKTRYQSDDGIDWDDELELAKRRVGEIIELDHERKYTIVLQKAICALNTITVKSIKDFISMISFPDNIRKLI